MDSQDKIESFADVSVQEAKVLPHYQLDGGISTDLCNLEEKLNSCEEDHINAHEDDAGIIYAVCIGYADSTRGGHEDHEAKVQD